jgi:hypothetical protein
MPKLYIDTNKFVGFYESNHDSLVIFEALAESAGSLVTTEQTVSEFHRNRVNTLRWLVGKFKDSVIFKPFTTSIMRAVPGHDELLRTADALKRPVRQVIDHLEEIIRDVAKDPVARGFASLYASPPFPLTPELVVSAHRRKLLGNPPSSPDKHTIGDEVIWETLLANCRDDLIVVSNDRTFSDNSNLISKEFAARTSGKKLTVTETIRDGLKALGKKPSDQLIEREKQIDEDAKRAAALRSVIEDPPDRNMLNPNFCFNCRRVVAWNGSRCLNCGCAAGY